MPVDRQAALQLGVLLLALPLQVLISSYYSAGDETERMMSNAVVFKERIFQWDTWQNWCEDFIEKVKLLGPSSLYSDDDTGQSPAVYDDEEEPDDNPYFAMSKKPRDPRPPHVQFRVGQVIRHKTWGYRGIIVGWDEETSAPESWIKQMHPKDKPHWRKKPSYSVLVDTRDRPEPQTTYVAEENIEIVSNTKVIHPAVEDNFEHYDGAQYIPRPWLRERYPQG